MLICTIRTVSVVIAIDITGDDLLVAEEMMTVRVGTGFLKSHVQIPFLVLLILTGTKVMRSAIFFFPVSWFKFQSKKLLAIHHHNCEHDKQKHLQTHDDDDDDSVPLFSFQKDFSPDFSKSRSAGGSLSAAVK